MRVLRTEITGLSACRYDYKAGWKLVSHRHKTFYQIFLVLDGEGTAWIEHVPHALQKDMVMFIQPGVAHGLRHEGLQPLRTLDVKFEVLGEALTELCQRLPVMQVCGDPEVFSLLEAVRLEAECRAPFYQEICQVKLKEILLRLARLQLAGKSGEYARYQDLIPVARVNHVLAQKLIEYLSAHYAEAVTAEGIAVALAYSYRHIASASHQAYGMTPMQVLMRIRIANACMQISGDRGSALKEIADACGFASVHHFSRVFGELMGISPGQWRERECSVVYKHYSIQPGFRDRDRTLR